MENISKEEVKAKSKIIAEALNILFGENFPIVIVRDKDGEIHFYGTT